MKTISFFPDGTQKHSVMESFNKIFEATQKLQFTLGEPNWDKIDKLVDEITDNEALRESALDTDYHDCGLDVGGEGACDNSMHKNYD